MQFPTFKPSQKRRLRVTGHGFALASLALILPAAHAQFRASIQGTVTDPQGYDTLVSLYNADLKQKPDPRLFQINTERMMTTPN